MASRPLSAATAIGRISWFGRHPVRVGHPCPRRAARGVRVEAEHRAGLVRVRVGSGHDEQRRAVAGEGDVAVGRRQRRPAARADDRHRHRHQRAGLAHTAVGLVDAAEGAQAGEEQRVGSRHVRHLPRHAAGQAGGRRHLGPGERRRAGYPRRLPQALAAGLDGQRGLCALRDGDDRRGGRRHVVGQRGRRLERLGCRQAGRRQSLPLDQAGRRSRRVPAGGPQPVVGDADDHPVADGREGHGLAVHGQRQLPRRRRPGRDREQQPAEGRRGLAGEGRPVAEHGHREALGDVGGDRAGLVELLAHHRLRLGRGRRGRGSGRRRC